MVASENVTSSIHADVLQQQGLDLYSMEGGIDVITTDSAPYRIHDAILSWDKNVTSGGTATAAGGDNSMRLCPLEAGNSTEAADNFYAMAQMITGLFIYPTFCFPGLVGNILTVVVLSQRNMLTSTNAFLSALAVSDSIKLVNDILYFFVTLFFHIDPVLGNLSYGYLYPYAHFIFSMSVCVSSWLTVSVAVERYILVCHPTRARNIWSRQRAVTLCCIIYVVMTSLALPSAFRYRTIRCFDVQLNASRLEVELTEMWQDELFVTSYTWAQNLLRSIIPLVVLVVLNVCIIRAVRRTKVKKKRKNSRHRVTVMMIVVILAFLICITPDAILSTVFGRGYHEAGKITKGIREITDTLLTINAAVNFIIYCALNSVFRKSFTHLCCPRSKRQGDGWVTEMDESVYRRFSEAKLSMVSSNNNHSTATTARYDTESLPEHADDPFTPSTPKSGVSTCDGHCPDNRFRYSSLSGGTSSPESPGFSSDRRVFFENNSTLPPHHQKSTSTSSNSTTSTDNRLVNLNLGKQTNCSSLKCHQHNSCKYQQQQQHHQPHKGSSHGLKKSRNSVKCSRGKRGAAHSGSDKDDDHDNCFNSNGGIQNEAVTYIPKEEFQNSLRRYSSGRQKQRGRFASSKTATIESDEFPVEEEEPMCNNLNSDKQFVLDLKSNATVPVQNESPTPSSLHVLSPDSYPSPSFPSSSSSPHTHTHINNDSPATINSDVTMDDIFQNDDTFPNDDTLRNDVTPPPTLCDLSWGNNSNSLLFCDTSTTSKKNRTMNGNSSSPEDSISLLTSDNGEREIEETMEYSRWNDASNQPLNPNKVKKRPLTVSFSDC